MRHLILLLVCLATVWAADLQFPVVLPPYGTDQASVSSPDEQWGSCLLYLESIQVFVFRKKSTPSGLGATISSDPAAGNTYSFDKTNVNCSKGGKAQTYEFVIDATAKKPAEVSYKDVKVFSVEGPISVSLKFGADKDFTWSLKNVTLNKALNVKKISGDFLTTDLTVPAGTKAKEGSVKLSEFGAYNGYNYACSTTNSVVFDIGNKDYEVGIRFGNIQVQREGIQVSSDKKNVRFTFNTHDCVGTFSAGSWMGILVSLLLASALVFGFLMLNSVQTIDRFDDPKQKQLVINAKD